MTVEEMKGSVVYSDEIDRFPIGMRVLAVDDDPTCLKLLDGLLRKCQYEVTTINQATTALNLLRENPKRFDLVISDVHMPNMDGFKLLELVGHEMDLPVIMLSGNNDPKLVMKGVTHGACDYLVKPVRLEELSNIWQHVIRRKFESKSQSKPNNNQERLNHDCGPEAGSGDTNGKLKRKRKDENEDDDPSSQKKPRFVWSIDLHRNFVAAINQLGIEKATTKKIIDLMNVEGLTRENVASHLQKYRLYLKRISKQANMSSLDGLGYSRSMSGSTRLPNAQLSSYSPSDLLTSATGMTLHSLTAPPVVQPTLVLPTQPNHQSSSNLFQEIPTSFDLDLLQTSNKPNTRLPNLNPVDESQIFNGSTSFLTLGSQSSLNLASSSSSFRDVENFHEKLLPNSSLKYGHPGNSNTIAGFSSAITSTTLVPLESQSQRPVCYGKQNYRQYPNNYFSMLDSVAAPPDGGGLGGPVSQLNDQVCGVTNSSARNELSHSSGTELKMGSSDNNAPRGFVGTYGYDSLDVWNDETGARSYNHDGWGVWI